MARLRLIVAGIVGTVPCLSILLLVVSPSVGVLAGQVDTLELQFQWAYPISITAMGLVDLDQDEASEILIGFESDSARLAIIDVVHQTTIWQSRGLPGPVLSVEAGDRNGDGSLDIIAGGFQSVPYLWRQGYFLILDGLGFDSVSIFSDIDQMVTAVRACCTDSTEGCALFAGTYRHYTIDHSVPPHHDSEEYYWVGNLLAYDGITLAPTGVLHIGSVGRMEDFDLDGDDHKDLILGETSCYACWGWYGDYEIHSVVVRVLRPEDTLSVELFSADVGQVDMTFSYVRFDALAVGDCNDDDRVEIISSHSEANIWPEHRRVILSCFDALTGDMEWEDADTGYAIPITGLAMCELDGWPTKVVCAAYQNGEIRFKSGLDGADLAIVHSLPQIEYFGVGNMDEDHNVEMCIVSAAADSVYVYEAPFIYTDAKETVDPTRPKAFSLHQNYPNPFNPQTTIRFTVVRRGDVRVTIYNILGERVRDFRKYCGPGTHTIRWDGKDSSGESVASGVYLYRLTVADYEQVRKMVLLR